MAIETIVQAVDASDVERVEDVVGAVSDVADPTGADVVLLHVFSEGEFPDIVDRLGYDPDERPPPDRVARRLTAVNDVASEFDDRGVDYEIRGVVDDDAGEAITRFAEDVDADLAYVGGRRRSPAGKALVGSVAQYVLLNAPCPVTFVRRD